MSIIDICLLAVIVTAVVLAIRTIIYNKRNKKGCGLGCTSCEGCSGCSHRV